MADGRVEAKTARQVEMWRERIAEHERSGLSVREFCKAHGLTAWSFYFWRKRLREAGPVRFALIERAPACHDSALDAQVEVVLGGGEEKLAMAGTVGIRSGGYAILPTTTQLVRTVATASAVIAGIEAVQMIRKGQVLWDYQS